MKISITGSSGFIGSAVIHELIKKGHYVRGCDVIPKRVDYPKSEYFFQGDFTQQQVAEDLVKGTDVCIHMGAVANLNWARQHPSETININVMGTARIAEACNKYRIPLVQISTCCTLGNTNEHPSSETALTNPTEIYGCTKLAAEHIVRGISSLDNRFPYRILRYSTVYGPGMREALATYIFSEKALKGEKLPIHGTGKQTRSFVYIDDLVYATIIAATTPLKNDIINIAGSENLSVLDIANTCLGIAGVPAKDYSKHLKYVEDRPGQVMKEWILIKQAEKTLHWKPKTKFKQGMKIAMEWVKARYK